MRPAVRSVRIQHSRREQPGKHRSCRRSIPPAAEVCGQFELSPDAALLKPDRPADEFVEQPQASTFVDASVALVRAPPAAVDRLGLSGGRANHAGRHASTATEQRCRATARREPADEQRPSLCRRSGDRVLDAGRTGG
jgi:hypothetical protein